MLQSGKVLREDGGAGKESGKGDKHSKGKEGEFPGHGGSWISKPSRRNFPSNICLK